MGAKYDFTASNGSLIMKRTPVDGDTAPKTITFRSPSLVNALGKIRLYEAGKYYTSLLFTGFGEIDGVNPTSLEDAETKLLALIPTASGGGGGDTNYNNVDAYDEDSVLPLTFDADTIHSFSIVAKTGTTTITVNGEATVLIAGQSTTITADALIDADISINSTTGEFLATVLS
jgi:hypothetical protein